jgi:hypothetical protein
MNNVRQDIIRKVNNLKNDETLVLTEDEVKYMVSRWIQGNWDNKPINGLKFYHYIEPTDPDRNWERIGAKIKLG